MIKEDFYTGEPLQLGSPNLSQTEEAAGMASFGKYNYEPGMNNYAQQPAIQQPVTINPGGYGYNSNNMVPGIGMNPPQPMYYNNGYYPNMYYNQQQYYPYGYNSGYYPQSNPSYNPSFGYSIGGFNNYQNQQPITSYRIEPLNPGGNEYLPPADLQDKIDALEMELWKKQQEEDIKRSVDGSMIYNNGYNYYGVPYYNPWQYNNCDMEIRNKIEEIKKDARENRIALNMKLSKLAHNIAGEQISDSAIIERYNGRVVQLPQSAQIDPREYQHQMYLESLVPFDNSAMYREYDAMVSAQHNKFVDPNADAKTAFSNIHALMTEYDIEEEQHRRKDGSRLYNANSGAYSYFVKKKAEERYKAEHGISSTPMGNVPTISHPNLNQFSTLSRNAELSDDGTLTIKVPFGEHAGEDYTVVNSQESAYNAKRDQFNSFLNSIPGSIYGNNNGGV
jgi:phage terminase small subunit